MVKVYNDGGKDKKKLDGRMRKFKKIRIRSYCGLNIHIQCESIY